MYVDFEILKNYVPKESLPILQKWFTQRPFQLKITKKRTTKLGDFRASTNLHPNRISVNSNLNQYAFLITLTHEFAHLLVWLKHKHRVKAHGSEWKMEFSTLMHVFLRKDVFPKELTTILQKHLENPPASSARDINLVKVLKTYDNSPSSCVQLIDIKEGNTFLLNKKRIFIKGKKRRTRYICKEISTQTEYLIHGVAEVERIDNVNN